MRSYADDDVLNMIHSGGRPMDKALVYIYQDSGIRRQLISYLIGQKVERDQAEDHFQEAVKIFILAVRADKFRGESSIKNYLFGVCKNLNQTQNVTQNRRRKLSEGMIIEVDENETPDSLMMKQERKQVLAEVLVLVGEKCQKVLQMWRMDYSMAEIAKALGYKSDGMARKKKHECMKKLMALVKKKPELISGIL